MLSFLYLLFECPITDCVYPASINYSGYQGGTWATLKVGDSLRYSSEVEGRIPIKVSLKRGGWHGSRHFTSSRPTLLWPFSAAGAQSKQDFHKLDRLLGVETCRFTLRNSFHLYCADSKSHDPFEIWLPVIGLSLSRLKGMNPQAYAYPIIILLCMMVEALGGLRKWWDSESEDAQPRWKFAIGTYPFLRPSTRRTVSFQTKFVT
jgi:hypothetical protein